MAEFFDFWQTKGLVGFFGIYWYFFMLEMPRYLLLDYAVLLIAYLKRVTGWRDYKRARREFLNERPFLSLIIPGKDEGRHYRQLVESLNNQTYTNFEIIIVDDGSDDETPRIGRELERSGEIDLFLRNNDRGGKA
ncbi:MAG: glycosyltransferase family 2 protein, partial [Balneolaceae bacterium]|nr:glycosyltransferase family 2 protein [Balneolaceae bacterium]